MFVDSYTETPKDARSKTSEGTTNSRTWQRG